MSSEHGTGGEVSLSIAKQSITLSEASFEDDDDNQPIYFTPPQERRKETIRIAAPNIQV